MLVFLVFAEVARNDEQHGAGPARSEMGESSADIIRHELGAVDLPHPLGDRLERLGHVEVRVPATALAHAFRDDQERRRILPGLADRAEGHLNPGGVQVRHDGAHADLLATRDAREGIGDGDGEALLPHHEDGHTLLPERVVHVVGRVAAHPGNALGLEGSREAVRRFDFHGCSPPRHVLARRGSPVKNHRGKLTRP